jgi:hypothetical protein
MSAFDENIFQEPDDVDVDTLHNLGPLRALAGTWEGRKGKDVHPEADGPVEDAFIEHYALQPIDPQTNGPQLFYGLRYHIHIVRPGEIATFHDQVGYWLWEPATGQLIQTVAIPRGQVAMAVGHASADATRFELSAARDADGNGILSNPYLDFAFRTLSYRIAVDVHADGTWSYEQDTVLQVRGQAEPFHHTDRNTLRKVLGPVPNPLGRRR